MGLFLMQSIDIFPWNKNFKTGVPIIDEQHQKLVKLINILASHLSNHSEESILLGVFDELEEYALYHFETEETLWHQFFPDDPLEGGHKKIHDDFIAKIQQLKQVKNKSKTQGVEDVLRFLINWLVFHILESDMHLAKVILAIQSGMSLQSAKEKADKQMRQHVGVLIKTILTMHEKLTSMTLDLSSEVDSRKKAEIKLRLAANVVENTLDAICITDSDKNIIDANPAFYKTTKFTSDEVLGRHIEDLKTGLIEEPLTSQLEKAILTDGQWSGIVSSLNKEGEMMMEWLSLSSVKNEHDDDSYYVAVFSEITHLADRLSDIEHLAYHDALTELPNRKLLEERLEFALANADRNKECLVVCYLDLDGFKLVNDQFGHEAGDEVLKTTAQRLRHVLRTNDTVSRVGGDEFILLLGDLKKPEDYKELLARILLEIEQPIQLEKEKVKVTASIGVTIYPLDNSRVDDLIQHADRAMSQAKQAGASSYVLYSADH
jgi:diguanylate cyclase (GGDEF)-like protein/hemerythrin-like metal-binding protein/PAS domain S-box-containing protein